MWSIFYLQFYYDVDSTRFFFGSFHVILEIEDNLDDVIGHNLFTTDVTVNFGC